MLDQDVPYVYRYQAIRAPRSNQEARTKKKLARALTVLQLNASACARSYARTYLSPALQAE